MRGDGVPMKRMLAEHMRIKLRMMICSLGIVRIGFEYYRNVAVNPKRPERSTCLTISQAMATATLQLMPAAAQGWRALLHGYEAAEGA